MRDLCNIIYLRQITREEEKEKDKERNEGGKKERVHDNPDCIINLRYFMYIYVTSDNVGVSFSYFDKDRRSRFSIHGNLKLRGFSSEDRLSQERGTRTYLLKSASLMFSFIRLLHAITY